MSADGSKHVSVDNREAWKGFGSVRLTYETSSSFFDNLFLFSYGC
jgi:hypothetical protein